MPISLTMRSFFHLLTLVALLFAPLAAPAVASVRPVAADCEQMESGAANHQMPADHHRDGQACCTAVPPAIDPPLSATDVAPPVDHPSFIAVTELFRLGAGPKVDDPPPRIA